MTHYPPSTSGPRAMAVLALVAATAACGSETAEPESLRPVRVAEAVRSDRASSRVYTGRTRAPVDSRLSFKVTGTILRMPVEVGAPVEPGTLVAALDPEDYETQVREASAVVVEVRSRAGVAEREYRRMRSLYAEDAVSLSAFDQARSAHRSAQARLEAAEERAKMASQHLSYTRLLAPAQGRVAAIVAEEGENVQPGQPVVELVVGGPLEVEVPVAETVVGHLETGAAASVSLPAFPDESLPAVVEEIGVAPAMGGTTYPVVLRVQDAPASARPGLTARVTFEVGAGPEGVDPVIVPTTAIQEDGGGRFALVVEAAPDSLSGPGGEPVGVVRRRAVRTGPLKGHGITVLDGLEPGDVVATAGTRNLRDGQRVRLPRPDSGPAGSAFSADDR